MLIHQKIVFLFFLFSSRFFANPSIASPKLLLSFLETFTNDIYCLVRGPGFAVQPVNAIKCSNIPATNLLSATWIWFRDGRLRGSNGFCLQYSQNFESDLSAGPCKHHKNDTNEIWSIKDGRLWSEAMNGSNEISQKPFWKQLPLQVKQFNESEILSLQRHTLEDEVATSQQRFRQLSKDIPDVTHGWFTLHLRYIYIYIYFPM